MIRIAFAAAVLIASAAEGAREPVGLHQALKRLTHEHRFSGAVVVSGPEGVRFARGYGLADPFTKRAFTPDTPVDGGSLAKPVTAAAVLLLSRGKKIRLDVPVRRYIAEYPHPQTTVAQLLAHSGGLPDYDYFRPFEGKTTSAMLRELGARRRAPDFAPGTQFAYCNLCYDTLALLIERVSEQSYQQFIDRQLFGPAGIKSSKLRPLRLSDWHGRAIGFRRTVEGKTEPHDSWEGEAFYGGGNIAFTAKDLARWAASWNSQRLAPIRALAARPAIIAGNLSGLSWGNWYCNRRGTRCHYPGHHEGFHSYSYWDSDRRIAGAMVSNNTLSPTLQQRLQRALVAFADGRAASAERELAKPVPARSAAAGVYAMPGASPAIIRSAGPTEMTVERHGIVYAAVPTGTVVRYVPGLDAYIASTANGQLRWLTLYEELVVASQSR